MVKRQWDQNCQCKDGSPGPRGPPGNKREMAMEGKQKHKGEMGMKGFKWDTGPPGTMRNNMYLTIQLC